MDRTAMDWMREERVLRSYFGTPEAMERAADALAHGEVRAAGGARLTERGIALDGIDFSAQEIADTADWMRGAALCSAMGWW